MIIIPSKNPHKLPRILMEITDYKYAHELSQEAYNHLKNHLDEKIAKYKRSRKYLASLFAKKAKDEEEVA